MKTKHIFLGLLTAVFISCSGDDDSTSPIPETAPQLIVKFKFDNTQVRLDNFGQPETIPAGNAAQSPNFNTMSAHYIELAPTAFTALGAGEICVNSIDADGMKSGYELKITGMIADAVQIPIIASGGAGVPEHLTDVLQNTKAEAALVASMVHYGTYTIPEIKKDLDNANVPMRMDW